MCVVCVCVWGGCMFAGVCVCVCLRECQRVLLARAQGGAITSVSSQDGVVAVTYHVPHGRVDPLSLSVRVFGRAVPRSPFIIQVGVCVCLWFV